MKDYVFIHGLEIACIIGIFDWERKVKQKVLIDIEFPVNSRKAAHRDQIQEAVDYKSIAKFTLTFVSQSRFRLIETLADKLAEALLKTFRLSKIRIRVSKPGAIRHSKNVGIEIVRIR